MEEQEYTVGTMEPEWGNGDVQNITFIVTEDCNLRCKYCYITHKAKGKKLALQTAKKFIDYLLNDNKIHRCQSIILDFIGGEPLLEAELIEDICDYLKFVLMKKKIHGTGDIELILVQMVSIIVIMPFKGLLKTIKVRYQLELQLMEQKKSMIFREYFQMGQDLMMLSIKILNCGWSSSQEVLK